MQVRNLDFVAAAWAPAARACASCSSEVLPNIASHLVVVATLEIALAILLEAALSFLGLGVPPPLPSWGLMIAEAKDYMFFSPWVIVIPGVALFVLVLGINLLGDGLRDLFGARTDRDERAARGRAARGRVSAAARSAVRGASLHRRARRDALPRGRIGLRQVGDRARRHGPAGPRRPAHGRAARLRGPGPAGLSDDAAWRGCAASAWP